MNAEKARQKLKELFGETVQFNSNFNERFSRLKEGMQHDFIAWCIDCKNGVALGSIPPKKEFRIYYVFFRKIGSDIRAILLKKKKEEFVEIILDNHTKYDDKRLELGYKKSSYYGN